MSEREQQMELIRQEIENLTESPLYEYRKEHGYLPVIGSGSLDARIMFVGEAPGKNEAKQGKPFVGQSGKVLDQLLDMIGLQRNDVYITNIVKDRPPDNRDPRKGEIALYAPFLERQIGIIQPAVIATLGRFSMEFIFGLFEMPEQGQKISALHGQVLTTRTGYGEASVVPLYHPAVALYNAGQRATLEQDFQVLKPFI